jgi:hypothetical protein
MNGVRKLACGLLCFASFAAASAVRADNVWTYYAAGADGNPTDAACVVHGEWVIKVKDITPSKGQLTLAHVVSAPADGVLDLRDVLLNGTYGNTVLDNLPVTSLSLPSNTNDNSGNWNVANIVEFYANNLAGYGEPFGRSDSTANTRLMHLSSTTMTAITGRYCNLTNLVLNMPNATAWSVGGIHNCSLTNDVAEIVPPWLQTIGNNMSSLGAGVTGTIVLTNLYDCGSQGVFPAGVSAGYFVFNGTDLKTQPFRGATGLRDFELVAPVCTNFYLGYNSDNVTNIVLDAPLVISTHNKSRLPLPSAAKSSVWFKNAPLGIDVVRMMVSGVTAVASNKNQDKNCTIYCSKKQGWKELASPLEGDYEAALAPDGCFGVLADASGNRRAWMVHRDSPHDKHSGFVYFLR